MVTTRADAKHCSRECKQAINEWRRKALCAGTCGRLIFITSTSLPAGEATCRDCRRSGVRRQQPAERPCPVCGVAFRPSASHVRTCSARCGAYLRAGRTDLGSDLAALYANKRTRDRERCARRRSKTAAQVVEYVDPDVVYTRDHWRCHICGQKVDRRLSGRTRMGPTLDHLIPLALGGLHSYANVALAHRACNSRKGVRPADTQLALLG